MPLRPIPWRRGPKKVYEAQLRDYFALRTKFFREAPVYQRIFCDAVTAPPGLLGVRGIYLSQPAADILTILVCLRSVKSMKQIASRNMKKAPHS